ncbi:hypothetical protein KY290_024136 [Solanum tuberosum]|uniref:Uncharacterized protein n=1 Tax=Solanum tuberosum TaxID=4113 RepID=A0ABQ7UPX8_SOLTU|nr:hypothetical protein KY285_022908 [Solanum tuberosum]KAH0753866.1 hypothetical protein KY290_024136 [Solanum tuberosum]
MLSSTLKSVVGSLPTVSEPNGSQTRSAPSLTMLKLNKTIFSPLQVNKLFRSEFDHLDVND